MERKFIRVWLPVLMLLVLSLGVSPLVAQDTLPYFEWSDCPFYILNENEVEGETIECGWLMVPENREKAGSPEIELAVAILYSKSDTAPDDPVVYLEGGPGGSALAGIDAWYNSALRDSYHLILIDQRGTGFSWPSLNCYELDDFEIDDPVQACHDRLVSEGVDLSAYNSRENAADINDLLVALDIDEANLFGVSYGTRLALTVARDYPERIRSIIIDAVFPPHVNGYEEQAVWGNRAFQTLFDNCANDADCNARYPNLREVFYAVVDDLNAEPIYFVDEFDEEVEYTGADLVNELFQLFYDSAAVPYIPRMIWEFGEGNFDYDIYAEIDTGAALSGEEGIDGDAYDQAFMDYLGYDDVDELYDYLDTLSDEDYYDLEAEVFGFVDDDSEGMFATVECYEEVPFDTVDRTEDLAAQLPVQIGEALLEGTVGQFDECLIWDIPAAPAYENEPVVSDIPTLVMSGEYDPITPPDWGASAAKHLSQSYHFVFPGMGHGTIDVAQCPTNIALDFLADPLSEPNGACIANMRVIYD